ncbi:MAG TPA: hypothetical protein VH186_31170 [Chloroflexia bacterium]|nr:hypothetical protein [Chloroflexia bacterium]
MTEVESIDGYRVKSPFLLFYKKHPEIGEPIADTLDGQEKKQHFTRACLTLEGSELCVEWIASSPPPIWMDGTLIKKFDIHEI